MENVVAAVKALALLHDRNLDGFTLNDSNVKQFLELCETLVPVTIPDAPWEEWKPKNTDLNDKPSFIRFHKYGSMWDVRAGTKPSMKHQGYAGRVDYFANYCLDTITCSRCTRTLRVVASSSKRIEFGKWDFDHVLDKQVVARVAKELLDSGAKVNTEEYFQLLWGTNIQLVCPACHFKERSGEDDSTKIRLLLEKQ